MLKINSLISILTLSILSGCASLPEEYSELRKVHVAVNKIPYKSDYRNYGEENYLATADEFYENGGDCEDYSLAKYHELKKIGYSPDDMMIILGEARYGMHAVLRVKVGDDYFILDNNERRVLNDKVHYFKPYMAYNENDFIIYSDKDFDGKTVPANLSKKEADSVKRIF